MRPERYTQHLNPSSGEYQNAWNCNTFIPPYLHTACEVHFLLCFLFKVECKEKINMKTKLWFVINPFIYRVSQEECARLEEGVPYVILYRYNPKHLYPKLNGYLDNGQRSLKILLLLLTYWLPNTYWNWQEYVVSVMLISVLNIELTCSDIKPLIWTTKTLALLSYLSLGFQVIYAGRSCRYLAKVTAFRC